MVKKCKEKEKCWSPVISSLIFGFFFYPFQNKSWFFTCLQYVSLENTVGKGEIACNEQFLLFQQCFLSVWRIFLLNAFSLKESKICRLGKG